MKKQVFGLLGVMLLLAACSQRDEITAGFAEAIMFEDVVAAGLPKTVTYAEKRGFADFTGDGIEDMIELNDEKWIGQEYKLNLFVGQYVDGVLQFKDDIVVIDLPIELEWFSSATKFDTGDVNGDEHADIIFTQYSQGIFEDSLHVAFALNNGDNTFREVTNDMDLDNGQSLAAVILTLISYYEGGDGESLYDYLKMDWADMDGNGSDDLVLAWDIYSGGSYDLYMNVFYTEGSENNPHFTYTSDYHIPDFMYNRNIREFDLEDFDGDGKADVFVHRARSSTSVETSVALSNGDHFVPHKDCVTNTIDMKFLAFEKYDTFDVNNDGRADFVHLGVSDGKTTMAYNLVK